MDSLLSSMANFVPCDRLKGPIPVFFTYNMTGTGGDNGMTSVASCKNQNSSYRGKFRSRELGTNSSYPIELELSE